MSDATFKFPCRACGAKLAFDPDAAELKCDHCGYTEAVPQSEEQVVEHDFEDYKPDVSGFGTETRQWDCQQCGAVSSTEPTVTSFTCPFCGSNQVSSSDERVTLHRPESVLPFRIGRDDVLERFRAWVKKLWFRPNALKSQARPDGLRGTYLPYWTYDTFTRSYWTAQSGTYYYVEDSDGNRVRKTRWTHAAGNHDEFFDDVLVPGADSVDRGILQTLEPFPTEQLVGYRPEYLAGYLALDYQKDMLTCWPVAKGRIDSNIRSACQRAIPGDTHRNLSVQTSYLNKTYKLCLLPIWIATYRYGGESYSYAVNGVTGEVAGKAPWSWIKIAFAAVCALAIAYGIYRTQQ